MPTSPTPHLCGFAATVFIWCLFARLVCDRLSFKQDLFLLRRHQRHAGSVAGDFLL